MKSKKLWKFAKAFFKNVGSFLEKSQKILKRVFRAKIIRGLPEVEARSESGVQSASSIPA